MTPWFPVRRVRGLLACCLVLVAFGSSSRRLLASPEAAHEHYLRALELLRNEQLREARQEFELAYQESPHYVVLFNLGKVSLDLGDEPAARRHLERYLAEGGNEIPEARRQEVEAMLERLGPGEDDGLQSAPAPGALVLPAPAPQQPLPVQSPPAKPPEPALPPPASRISEHEIAEQYASGQRRTAAYVLGATGLTLLATAGVLFIWNSNRYADAEAERSDLLDQAPPAEVFPGDQDALDDALAYQRALAENQADFDSVSDFYRVGAATAITGAVLLGVGVALFATSSERPSVVAGLRRVTLHVGF